MDYLEECSCQWCANLDARPCSVIESLERRVAALETQAAQITLIDGSTGEPIRRMC